MTFKIKNKKIKKYFKRPKSERRGKKRKLQQPQKENPLKFPVILKANQVFKYRENESH